MAEQENSISLSKYIAVCGIASRRHSVELIKAGKITVNGAVELNPAARVTKQDTVLYGGKPVRTPEKRHYVMLHKPRGYVCTSEDVHAAKKAIDLINMPGHPRLYSAGRLDKDSEGLILFSDDGDFVNALTHPRNRIFKTYEVSMDHPLSARDIQHMEQGIHDAGETLRALSVTPIGERKYRFILGEGKNREIRRMAAAVRNDAVRLKRVAVGRLRLGDLPCGYWRELNADDCKAALCRQAAVPPRYESGK